MNLTVFGTLHGSVQATGAPPEPVLPGLLSKRAVRPGWAWAPKATQSREVHPPTGVFLLSPSGGRFWMHRGLVTSQLLDSLR